MAADDRLVNEATARELLGGIGKTTFYGLIGSGALGIVHVGKRVFVPVSQINAFIEAEMEHLTGGPMTTMPMATCDSCGLTFKNLGQHKRMKHKNGAD
jgi:hypothetical protein